jgi:hypothetical protein
MRSRFRREPEQVALRHNIADQTPRTTEDNVHAMVHCYGFIRHG